MSERREIEIRLVNKPGFDAFLQELREWKIPETDYRTEINDDLMSGQAFKVFAKSSNVIDVLTETLLPQYYIVVKAEK